MTEKEKRDAGMLYDANHDEILLEELTRCKDICHRFNLLPPSNLEERNPILSGLFGSIGSVFTVQSPFFCDYGYNIHVGNEFYANHGLVILDAAKVSFGDHVFIGPNCGFYTATHPIDPRRRSQGLEQALPITIGDHVWFGGGVQVLPNVTIGSNVVIGSGAVVTKNIPSNVVAMGNPCAVHRPIREDDLKL